MKRRTDVVPLEAIPLPRDPILSQMNSAHASTPYFLRSILTLSFRLCIHLPSSLFPSNSSVHILFAFLISPTCATCYNHLILIDLIILILFCEEYKL
jgi:hypothetical protein